MIDMSRIEIEVIGAQGDIERLRQIRESSTVIISPRALHVAIMHAIGEKDKAIDNQDFEAAASWNDQLKDLCIALGGFGLSKIEQED
jgi:hypothetical protein